MLCCFLCPAHSAWTPLDPLTPVREPGWTPENKNKVRQIHLHIHLPTSDFVRSLGNLGWKRTHRPNCEDSWTWFCVRSSIFFFFFCLSGDTKRRQREPKESVNIKKLLHEIQHNCHDDMFGHTTASAHLKAHWVMSIIKKKKKGTTADKWQTQKTHSAAEAQEYYGDSFKELTAPQNSPTINLPNSSWITFFMRAKRFLEKLSKRKMMFSQGFFVCVCLCAALQCWITDIWIKHLIVIK